MPRRNRVDPWGDLHAVSARGMFTGNRGCVVNGQEKVVRHHASALWIICKTEFRDRRLPLARPNRWTPLFFLDEAVALAAGHRPCAFCRRQQYRAYRDAVTRSLGAARPLLASELNARLNAERHHRGRGLERAQDRIIWSAKIADLPDGSVIVDDQQQARLVFEKQLFLFEFSGWTAPISATRMRTATVLTPPSSVAALKFGYALTLSPLTPR